MVREMLTLAQNLNNKMVERIMKLKPGIDGNTVRDYLESNKIEE